MKTFYYITSLLTFYLRGEITIDMNNVRISQPNTILKLIPLGKKKNTLPVNQLTSVDDSFSLDFKTFIIGVIFAIIALTSLKTSFVMFLIFGILAALQVINSFQTILIINTASGVAYSINFLIFDKKVKEDIYEVLNLMITQRLNDTNYRIQNEQTNKILKDILNK